MTVSVSTLHNGLRVATDSMADAGSVTLGVWIDVGTCDEPVQAHGLAHLVEHMLFKGTQRRSALDLSVEIENVGGFLNAYTSREETAYHARVLPEDAPLACDLIADMIRHATFPEDELDRERGVIIQEIGQYHDAPEEHLFDMLQNAVYPNQTYGRSILGTAEAITGIRRQTLVDYVNNHYHPSRMILAAAGTINHDQLMALAEHHFADLPAGPPAPSRRPAHFIIAEQDEARDLEQLHLALAFPGVGARDPDYYAVQMLMTILGGGMSSRLFQEVREKRGLAYSVGAGNQTNRDAGLIALYAGTAPAKHHELLAVLREELSKVTRHIDADEHARARAQLRASLMMAQESSSARAEQLAMQVMIHGRPQTVAERLAKLDMLTPETLVTVANRYLSAYRQGSLVRLGQV